MINAQIDRRHFKPTKGHLAAGFTDSCVDAWIDGSYVSSKATTAMRCLVLIKAKLQSTRGIIHDAESATGCPNFSQPLVFS
jgi:hypothetical protein